jgi:hypothetical protein
MTNIDTYRYLIGAYYGVREMDEYPIKEFVLKEIEDYIDDFCKANNLSKNVVEKEKNDVEINTPLRVKLQDALLLLPKLESSTELILLIKKRIKSIKEEEVDTF